jgi:hypothetical protein
MCASGCRNYDIFLTEEEARRLSFGFWRSLLHEVPDDLLLVKLEAGQYTLNKVDGRCVFLDRDNLCVVHKASGLEAKPIACQFFPFHAIAAPDGAIHVALNTGCRRLVEMNADDAPLDAGEAARLLDQVEAVTTLPEAIPLTPTLHVSYPEFLDWQARLGKILEVSTVDYLAQMRTAATLLLTIPFDAPAEPSFRLFADLERLIYGLHPDRQNIAAQMKRVAVWLPAMHTPIGYYPVLEMPESLGDFYSRIATQYLDGHQVALHRTARTGWVALLAAMVAGWIGASAVLAAQPDQNPRHVLNNVLSDALELFFAPVGQIALTEPNQEAFLQALSNLSR